MNNFYKKHIPYLFILPAMVLMAVFFFVPFFETFILSFKDFSSDIYAPIWAGLQNYAKLFHSAEFYTAFANTFIFLIMVVPFLSIFPLIVAIFINQKLKGISIYKILRLV